MYQVYIVDDAVLARKALVLTVPWNLWGCVVTGSADDGDRALLEIEEKKPDIVVTDIRMTRMSGLELIRACAEKSPKTQFIIISGYNEFAYAQQAMKLDVVDYLLKPFDDEDLHQAVERAKERMERSRRRSEDPLAHETELPKLLDPERHLNAYLTQALAYIQEHYGEELSLRMVAEHLRISESYLTKLFKTEISLTFLEYLTRVRIRKAAELMRKRHMPIYEIAESVGYKDYRHFSAIFKKYVGVGAKEYRMRCGALTEP